MIATLLGREDELRRLRELLESSAVRLLTVIGPPGVGKSRLAMALCEGLLDEDLMAVHFVDLAAAPDGRDLGEALAGPLGAARATDLPDLFGERDTLLVLDHGDWFAGPVAPAVRALLAASPRLRVLLTGREPFRVYGERLFRLQPLPVPGEPPPEDLAELARVPSVALLLDRAPGLRLTEENRAAVAALCTRLDGLPLALELAAARLRLYQPAALLDRLERGLEPLSGDPSDTLSRHHSMAAAIRWSYDRLSADERALLRALSLFHGGGDLEAVAAVSGLPAETLDATLRALVDRSLVEVGGGPTGEPRFSLLHTVRGFAQGELGRSGAKDALTARHAEYYAGLALRPAPAGVPAEAGNLRAAARWLRGHGRGAEARAVERLLGACCGGPAPGRAEPAAPARAGQARASAFFVLTRRESQVADLIAEGLTNRQIARRLGIAEWTAINHVRNVMRKLDCTSRVHVASLVSQHGG